MTLNTNDRLTHNCPLTVGDIYNSVHDWGKANSVTPAQVVAIKVYLIESLTERLAEFCDITGTVCAIMSHEWIHRYCDRVHCMFEHITAENLASELEEIIDSFRPANVA